MSQGGGGPPTEIGPRFEFLKRGTGTKKFEKINYITNKSSPRPSATSIGMPSTSAAEEIEPEHRRPPGVSRLNLRMSPTNNDNNRQPSDRDSGRGSAAPQQEPIYSAPSNRRVDSGYGEYQNVSPFRGSESPLEHTLQDDQNMTTVIASPNATLRHHTPGSLVSTGDDDVFINESRQHLQQENNQNASLSSFIRHERDAEEGIERTELSTPTRELQGGIRSREPSTIRSQSSACSDPYAPMTSTPIQDVTITETPANLPVPRPRRVALETPILQATPSIRSSSSTRPPSSTSFGTPTPSFQMPSISSDNDSQLSSERRFIAPNDRPLRQAFPSDFSPMEYNKPRNPIEPSKSTQFRPKKPRGQSSPPRTRENQENNVKKAIKIVDSLVTPRAPLRSMPDTEIVKMLMLELRNTTAHMDLKLAHVNDSEKMMKKIYEHKEAERARKHAQEMAELKAERAQLNKERELFEEEKQDWRFNARKEREALKKDRDALKKDEEAFAKRTEESNAQVVDAKRESADYRVRWRKKEDENKKLREEIEKREAAKQKSEKSVQQMKNTYSRQLKTKEDRIRELEQSLEVMSGELKKSRNGLKPGPQQRATTTPTVAPPSATREPESPPPQLAPASQRKEVRFDLENIDYREDSRTDFSQDLTQESYYEWYPETTFENLPMGMCYPIVGVPPFHCDESMLIRNYAYQVRHNNGKECGAFLYKFYNNDAKWVYGPVEAYLHHTFPLVVKLADQGVEIRVVRDKVEIHRPSQEITRYDLSSQTTIDTRRRRDDRGFYAVKNDVRLGVQQNRQPEILASRSDRSREEDAQVIRRGNTAEKHEYMQRNHARGELSWFSMDIQSNQIQFYQVHVAPEADDKPTVVVIRVGFQNQFIDIISVPSMDFVYTRHRFDLSTKGYVNCCDFGKAARDRERSGQFIAFSPELPLKMGLISSA